MKLNVIQILVLIGFIGLVGYTIVDSYKTIQEHNHKVQYELPEIYT